MKTEQQPQKTTQANYSKYLLGFILLFTISSMIPLANDRYTSIDYHLSGQIKEQLNLAELGHVQSIKTQTIGPYTSIELRYFEQNNQLVSAKGYQILGFEPVVNCISSLPDKIC